MADEVISQRSQRPQTQSASRGAADETVDSWRGERRVMDVWKHPRIYDWTGRGSRPAQVFETFLRENRWLQKLLDAQFLTRRPILGVPGADRQRMQRLLQAWFWRVRRRFLETATSPCGDDDWQKYIFGAIVARAIIRHHLHSLVHGRITKEEAHGAVFWPPGYFLVHGTRVFDFKNWRPQAEFFEEAWRGTRHPAVVAGRVADRGRGWYVLLPLTSTGQGERFRWTALGWGEKASGAVVELWMRATEEMLGRYDGRGELSGIAMPVESVNCHVEGVELEALLCGCMEADREDEFIQHVAHCDRCLLKLQELVGTVTGSRGPCGRSGSEERGEEVSRTVVFEAWQEALRKLAVKGLKPQQGQVWTTRARGIRYPGHERDGHLSAFDLQSVPRAVVILQVRGRVAGFQELCVAPTSLALEVALPEEGDVVVPAEQSPAGVPFVVEVWNEQPMLAENLDCCIGELPSEVMERVFEARGKSRPVAYRDVVLHGLEKDPRWRFRAEEFEETAYLREPAESARVLQRERVRGWLGELAERVRWAVASVGQLAPVATVAAAGQGVERAEVEGTTEGVRWKLVREEGGSVWVWVETQEAGVEKVVALVGGEGEAEPVVRAEVRVVEVGPGRYGGTVFVGRWEDLGLGESAVVVLVWSEQSEASRGKGVGSR